MKYETARPRVAGYYWCRCARVMSGGYYEAVVKVYCSRSDKVHGVPDAVFWDGDDFAVDDSRFVAFAGPIPPPEDGAVADSGDEGA